MLIAIVFVAFLLFSGCTTEQNGSDQTDDTDTTDDTNEINDGSSDQNGDEFDSCGNAVGNGYEIISGPSGPEHEGDRDNPFRSLTVHPNNSDIILVGTERNGFVKSVDGGTTWTRLRKGLRHQYQGYPEVYDIAFSQSNPDAIYAATLDGPGPLTGDYPTSSGGIYKSTDGGETWQRKNCGLNNGWIFSVYVSPNDSNNAIIGISGGLTTFTGWDISGQYFDGGIFRTTDGGENWNRINITQYDNTNAYMIIRGAKENSSLLYTFGSNYENLSQNVGWLKSTDGGATWTQFASEFREHLISYFDISSDGSIIYAVDTYYIQKSTDSGEIWTRYELFSWGYALAIFPDDPNKVLVSNIEGVFLSTDGLATKTQVILLGEEQGHISDIAIAPSDTNIAYVITTGYDFYKSTDGGVSFTKIINLRNEVLNVIP
jgi:photosystem II stability/assembly factor-like uncharacterized protein